MDYYELRKSMVQNQLIKRGIKDEHVLSVFLKVARHKFVLPELINSAYEDCPLSIGNGQTISQPYIVALMTEALKLEADARVLEIGTGSGYQTAILAELAKEVYSVERIKKIAENTQQLLRSLGYNNTHIIVGDGTLGVEIFKPYNAIIVTAGAPRIPFPLLQQLKDDTGRMIIPIGDRFSQVLTLLTKKGENVISQKICDCVFVPLLGKEGWETNDDRIDF